MKLVDTIRHKGAKKFIIMSVLDELIVFPLGLVTLKVMRSKRKSLQRFEYVPSIAFSSITRDCLVTIDSAVPRSMRMSKFLDGTQEFLVTESNMYLVRVHIARDSRLGYADFKNHIGLARNLHANTINCQIRMVELENGLVSQTRNMKVNDVLTDDQMTMVSKPLKRKRIVFEDEEEEDEEE